MPTKIEKTLKSIDKLNNLPSEIIEVIVDNYFNPEQKEQAQNYIKERDAEAAAAAAEAAAAAAHKATLDWIETYNENYVNLLLGNETDINATDSNEWTALPRTAPPR